ncbi:MAG TPA: hypothetical protein VGI83_07370 [Gemmatimonadales bacterium]|jgi:hypothetical protein
MRHPAAIASTMLLALCSSVTLAAQSVPLSLRAGAAWSSNRPAAPSAGLGVERPLSGPASIRLEVGYVGRGLNDSAQNCGIGGCARDGVNLKADFLTFTALFVLSSNRPLVPFFAAGPYLAPRLACRDITVGDCDRVDTSDGGLAVETGVILTAQPPIVSLELRYERALAATVQFPADDSGDRFNALRYQTLSVALRLRLGAFGKDR